MPDSESPVLSGSGLTATPIPPPSPAPAKPAAPPQPIYEGPYPDAVMVVDGVPHELKIGDPLPMPSAEAAAWADANAGRTPPADDRKDV